MEWVSLAPAFSRWCVILQQDSVWQVRYVGSGSLQRTPSVGGRWTDSEVVDGGGKVRAVQ